MKLFIMLAAFYIFTSFLGCAGEDSLEPINCMVPEVVIKNKTVNITAELVYLHTDEYDFKDNYLKKWENLEPGQSTERFKICKNKYCGEYFVTFVRAYSTSSDNEKKISVTTAAPLNIECELYNIYILEEDFITEKEMIINPEY